MAATHKEPEIKEVVKYIEVERKTQRPEKFNVWASVPEADYEFVTIPATDLHGYSYPPIAINQDRFNETDFPHPSLVSENEDGRTYRVPPLLAAELRRIMARAHEEQMALLQPRSISRNKAKQAVHAKGTAVPGYVPGAVPQ